MTERYMCVKAKNLRPNDRILEYDYLQTIPVGDGYYHTRTLHIGGESLRILSIKMWVDFANFKCIRADVTHYNGDDEYLFLRALSPVWVMRPTTGA